VVSPSLLEQLGPAAVSGKPLFLYGPPGNGKTTIAVRLGQIWDDVIIVPYALYVEGNVIRVYDEITHQAVKAPTPPMSRWTAAGSAAVVPRSSSAAN
jgi:predicted ATPase with chaperone activity